MPAAKDPYNHAMIWLPLLLVLLATPARAADPVQVNPGETSALVDAIRGRPLNREQHDVLVNLGRRAEEGNGEDRLWVGWALVFADRPDLGLPLVQRGLSEVDLGASDALRTLLFAEATGQDGLVRATVDLLRSKSPEGARRLERSIRRPVSLPRAERQAAAALRGLEVGRWELPFPAGSARRVTWWVRPPSPTGAAVIWLPDGAAAEGLPPSCQDAARLREAAVLARAGHPVYLPGLRGCDGSDGVYRGSEDAARDLGALVPRIREVEGARELVLLGLESGGLLALRLADAVAVDRVVAWQPDDPGEPEQLPPDVVAARDIAQPPRRAIYVARPYPALAQVLGLEPTPWLRLRPRRRAAEALSLLEASAATPGER